MCGILAGKGSLGLNRWLKGLKAIEHRGPCSSAYYHKDEHFLGHNRLSLTGGPTGVQPLYNEDKTLVLIANGEVYDYKTIRGELEALGHKFSTESDSEIFLHYFESHGAHACLNLRGEYAFVIYDIKNEVWYLGRDAHGTRPLKYKIIPGGFIVTSEAKALKALGINLKINTEVFEQTLSFQYHHPNLTWFEGVLQVPAGSIVRYKAGKMATCTCPTSTPKLMPLKDALIESVCARIPGEVPFCTHLSGGLDSGLITLIAAQKGLKQSFTVDFPDTPYSELQQTKLTAQHAKVDLNILSLTNKELFESLEKAVWHGEDTGINAHYGAKYLLAKYIASKGFNVTLTGEGADEYFYGYAHFQKALNSDYKVNPLVQGMHTGSGTTELPGWLEAKQELFATLRNLLTTPVTLKVPVMNTGSSLKVAQTSWIQYGLISYIIPTLDDGVGMAGPVESRLPFLDAKVIAASKEVSMEAHKATEIEKPVLRNTFKELLPESLYLSKKLPFIGPSMFAYARESQFDFTPMLNVLSIEFAFSRPKLKHWLETADLNPSTDCLFTYLLTLYYLVKHYVD